MKVKAKLIIAGIGNFIDGIATFILTQFYGFQELNPFMLVLLQWPVLAITLKIMVVTSLLFYIYHKKDEKYMNGLATFAASFYGFMGLYYILIFLLI